MLPVPPELVLKILADLQRRDQLAFSSVSRATRELAVPLIFHEVAFGERREKIPIQESIDILTGSSQNVKNSVRYLLGASLTKAWPLTRH
jgi:hypothetical protein